MMRVHVAGRKTVVEQFNVFENPRPKEPKTSYYHGPGVWERLTHFFSYSFSFSHGLFHFKSSFWHLLFSFSHICIYRQMELLVFMSQAVHSGDLRALHRRFLRGGWLCPRR
jgi:hypothetical protein